MNSLLKRVLGFFTLLGLGMVLTGCVVAIGTGKENSSPAVVVADSADAATLAEIDAAARLNMDGGRTAALLQIAERGVLAKSVQVHLVNTAYRRLTMDGSKLQLLGRVIAHPDFGDAARHAIVSQLHKLSFDSSRQQILQQISERLKVSPAH